MLTDEEIEQFTTICNSEYHNDMSNWDDWEDDEPPPPPLEKYCWHDWKKDSYFSNNVYYTCSKCGAKKEDQ